MTHHFIKLFDNRVIVLKTGQSCDFWATVASIFENFIKMLVKKSKKPFKIKRLEDFMNADYIKVFQSLNPTIFHLIPQMFCIYPSQHF